jgi:hypothetical protein
MTNSSQFKTFFLLGVEAFKLDTYIDGKALTGLKYEYSHKILQVYCIPKLTPNCTWSGAQPAETRDSKCAYKKIQTIHEYAPDLSSLVLPIVLPKMSSLLVNVTA